ncbi:MAG: hypothetical protein J6Q14_01160 [Oscillospiraceae bacterium]|nr:hypothetical protein [Oscillospiraceae bacterium]
MKLYERLPDRVEAGGRRYKVDLDFRNVLRMMEVMGRDDLIPQARDWLALRCIMRRPPKDTGPLMTEIRKLLFPAHKGGDGKRLTSFEQDADLIRAAFRQAYGIDLYRDRLHWLEFAALLSALPDGSRYSEVLGIRARPMPSPTKYNQQEREWLAKAKAAVALELDDKERAKAYEQGVKALFAGLVAWAEKGGESNG